MCPGVGGKHPGGLAGSQGPASALAVAGKASGLSDEVPMGCREQRTRGPVLPSLLEGCSAAVLQCGFMKVGRHIS